MSSDTKQVADFSALKSIKAPEPREERLRVDSWPDRSAHAPAVEASVQISVRAPVSVINRLRGLCKRERYSYGEMLERMLDAYEGREG